MKQKKNYSKKKRRCFLKLKNKIFLKIFFQSIQNQQNGFHSPLENFGQENGHLIEYRTLSTQSDGSEENVGDENNLIQIIYPAEDDKEVNNKNKYPRRKMSLADQSRLDTVTRLRSWLQASYSKIYSGNS